MKGKDLAEVDLFDKAVDQRADEEDDHGQSAVFQKEQGTGLVGYAVPRQRGDHRRDNAEDQLQSEENEHKSPQTVDRAPERASVVLRPDLLGRELRREILRRVLLYGILRYGLLLSGILPNRLLYRVLLNRLLYRLLLSGILLCRRLLSGLSVVRLTVLIRLLRVICQIDSSKIKINHVKKQDIFQL